jgi:hypothetical protein
VAWPLPKPRDRRRGGAPRALRSLREPPARVHAPTPASRLGSATEGAVAASDRQQTRRGHAPHLLSLATGGRARTPHLLRAVLWEVQPVQRRKRPGRQKTSALARALSRSARAGSRNAGRGAGGLEPLRLPSQPSAGGGGAPRALERLGLVCAEPPEREGRGCVGMRDVVPDERSEPARGRLGRACAPAPRARQPPSGRGQPSGRRCSHCPCTLAGPLCTLAGPLCTLAGPLFDQDRFATARGGAPVANCRTAERRAGAHDSISCQNHFATAASCRAPAPQRRPGQGSAGRGRRGGPVPWCTPCSARSGASPGPGLPRDPRSARRARRCAARRCLGARRRCSPARCKGTRRVQLVWRDGRDVSTLYGREGGVVVLACAVCRSDVPSRGSRLRAWRCVSRRRSDRSIASSVSWAARAAASRAAPASTRASASASRSAAASRASSVSRCPRCSARSSARCSTASPSRSRRAIASCRARAAAPPPPSAAPSSASPPPAAATSAASRARAMRAASRSRSEA